MIVKLGSLPNFTAYSHKYAIYIYNIFKKSVAWIVVQMNGFSYYIKEATSIFDHPLSREKKPAIPYDVQLNIFCFRKPNETTRNDDKNE